MLLTITKTVTTWRPVPLLALAASLSVQNVDMCQQINKPKHFTTDYDTESLVVRRGLEFLVRVTFSRPLSEQDDFQLEFLIGSNPSASKGSLIVVTFGSRHGGPWSGRIVETQGETLTLGITPRAEAIVGKFRTYVAIVAGSGLQRTSRDTSTDMYLLFNAWCPEDTVYVANEGERREYVLNDSGVIFQGTVESVSQRTWMYGQFERGILDACIYILDMSRMPITDRGHAVKLIRKGSAMINSQDDNGVLVGNWRDDFSMGTSPTLWTGSTKILQKYANTGVPICYGQCWVFAGVFNTFLRCLGLPARVITNFSSAHDNTGNLKIELIFKPDGTPDRRHTRDSIWNYHCWNEVFMVRPDLPSNFTGWQVVDATPQETSDGHFRCGPAPVAAIKDGLLCHPFDCGFVFAEVNSDLVCLKRDRFGTLSPFRVDKNHIGQAIYTKAVGNNGHMDITHTYKYAQGTPQDDRTMARAEEYGCARDHYELVEDQLSIVITADQVTRHDLNLVVQFQNKGEVARSVQAHLAGSVVFYTGVLASHFKDEDFTATVPALQSERHLQCPGSPEYMPHMAAQVCLYFVVTGQAEDQSLNSIKVVEMVMPRLTMTVQGQPQVKQQMMVNVSFTNPFNFQLHNINLFMEGPGLMEDRSHQYSVLEPQASFSWVEMFTPRLHGLRRLVAGMDLTCRRVFQVWGVVDIQVST
uniref:protein-glutamine gamma-glutamyltransferase n=1 Tax=Scophthalmus maximus TaxID=52904 RepID=A0A8D3AJF9_SCOMX